MGRDLGKDESREAMKKRIESAREKTIGRKGKNNRAVRNIAPP